MSTNLQFKLTSAGIASAFNAGALSLNVTHVQLGSGNRTASGNEIALQTPKESATIGGHINVGTGGQSRIAASFLGSLLAYSITEIGLWSGAPGATGSVLVFYWSLAAGSIAIKSANINFNLEVDLFFGDAVPANITIVADTNENALSLITGFKAELALSTGSTLVGTTQTGTAAVTRTAASKLNEVLSAKDFGSNSTITGSITNGVLTLSSATSGKLAIGSVLTGAGITSGVYVSALSTGTLGVAGSTYKISNTTLTVTSTTISAIIGKIILDVPSQYGTIQAALGYLNNYRIASGTEVVIQVASNSVSGTVYTVSGQVSLYHPDGMSIRILGNVDDPSKCTLNFSTNGFWLYPGRSLLELNGFKLHCTAEKKNESSKLAITADGGTFNKVGPNIIVDNFYYGISAWHNGYVDCSGVTVTNSGDCGIWSFIGSFVKCNDANVSGSNDSINELGGGIVAEFSSSIEANRAITHDNWLCGFSSISGSAIRAWSSVSYSNKHGLITGSGGVIEVFDGAVIRDNSAYGFSCIDGTGEVYGIPNTPGSWSNLIAYGKGSYVSYLEFMYYCKVETTAGIVPTDTGYWIKSVYGNTLGNFYNKFTFSSSGQAQINSGTVLVDGLASGAVSGGNAYVDLNSSNTAYGIIRGLVSGVEKGRIQHSGADGAWNIISNGCPSFTAYSPPSSVNYVQADGATTGKSVNVKAYGSDAVIDLGLYPKGTGSYVNIGAGYTPTPITCTGYIVIKDNVKETRRLMVG